MLPYRIPLNTQTFGNRHNNIGKVLFVLVVVGIGVVGFVFVVIMVSHQNVTLKFGQNRLNN